MTSPVAVLPQICRSWKAQLTNSNSASEALVTAVTPSASFTFAKMTSLIAVNDDASNAYTVTWGRTRGGVFYPLGTILVPASSGLANGTPPINLLNPALIPGLPIDADGQCYIFLEQAAGDTVQVQSATTVASGKHVSISADGGEY
jgi:hypothetical protein